MLSSKTKKDFSKRFFAFVISCFKLKNARVISEIRVTTLKVGLLQNDNILPKTQHNVYDNF